MPIDLYYMSHSAPSRTALIVAKLVGVEVNIKVVNLFEGEHKKPEFLKINPNHTIPVLDDNGFVLCDSAAISTYLVNKYNPGHEIYPSDPQARAKVDEALHFIGSALGPAIRGIVIPMISKQEPSQEAMDNFKEKFEVVLNLLGDKKFLTGNSVTIPDISLAGLVYFLESLRETLVTAPLVEYLERVKQACPTFKQVLDTVPPRPKH